MSGIPRSPDLVQSSSETSAIATEEASQYPTTTKEEDVQNLRTDCGYEIIDNFIKLTKKRCKELQGIADRFAYLLSELQTLLDTYRKGLAYFLLRKCHFYLMRKEHMEMLGYAAEFRDLAIEMNNTVMLQVTQHLMSKKFVLGDSHHQPDTILFQTSARVLHENQQFFARWKSNELYEQEYGMLDRLFSEHIVLCDFQFVLDLGQRLLEIAYGIQDMAKMIYTLAQFGNLLLLLGRYERSFDIMRRMIHWKIEAPRTKYILFCNLSVVELLLGRKDHSLQHARDSLGLAVKTNDLGYIACAYGNIGLALEYLGNYMDALEPYEQCLQIGRKAEDYRVINNGLCNLGRAYQGLGNVEKAKVYFKQAVNTPRPPKAYWCDTEKFRFSGDYLLAKLAVQEKNWDEARKHLKAVIKRCETLRKSIQDSQTKITFNDIQRKPFQLLQHVMLEDNNTIEALVVAEKGRGRDFFDKIEGDVGTPLDSENILLDMIKIQNIAVLFISALEEVNKLSLWFISSKGELLKHCLIPSIECNELFSKLSRTLHHMQGRYEIEFKATAFEEYSLVEDAIELTSYLQSLPGSCLADEESESKFALNQQTCNTQEQSQTNSSLQELLNELSKLILIPFEKELKNVINEPSGNRTPRLLIIPQGASFNIPFAALKFDRKPLCHNLTIIEAFSFHSFDYFTTESEHQARMGDFKKAVIVGNPTHQDALPRAEEEAKGIAKIFGVIPLIGDQATKNAVMKRLPKARLIHFSCHGEESGEALLMAKKSHMSEKEYRLTARDVENIKLDADLVVLSACHTAHGKINSEGVIGLARAFQVAGARSIVTALWAIPDDATKKFMEEFYDNLCNGHPVADAIRATQVKMSKSEEFSDVINWGSFKVFGANARIMGFSQPKN